MTTITKRVEIRADMQIEDGFFKHLCKKLNRSSVWKRDRKVYFDEKFLKSASKHKSYVIDKAKSHKVEYQKVELQGSIKGIQFTEEAKKFVVKDPKKGLIMDIIRASKKDLDWISIVNQCFQKKFKKAITIKEIKEDENLSLNEKKFEVSFSLQLLAIGKVEAKNFATAKKIISQRMIEHFFPPIFNALNQNLENIAKESEMEENSKFKKKQNYLKERQRRREEETKKILEFKKEELYGDLDKKIKDKRERDKILENQEKIVLFDEKKQLESTKKTEKEDQEVEIMSEGKKEIPQVAIKEDMEKVKGRYESWSKYPIPSEEGKLRYIPKESIVVETGVQEFIEIFQDKFPPHLKGMEKERIQKEISSILRRSKTGFKISNKSCGMPKEFRYLLHTKTCPVLSSYSYDRNVARDKLNTAILKLFDKEI